MKNLIVGLFLIISVASFAQQKNNEVGIKLGTAEYLFNNFRVSGYIDKLHFYSPIHTFKQELPNNNFYLKNYTYQKGISTPEIYFRKRLYKRIWFANTLTAFSYSEKSDTAFGTGNVYSSGGENYEIYNHSFKTISFTPSLQFEWLKKRLKASAGIQYNINYSQIQIIEKGSYWGCFGVNFFDVNKKMNVWYSNYFSLQHYLKYRVYKNYYVGHEVYFNPFNVTLFNSITVSKMF